ncbi:rhomboid family intramembrane serine protease [Nakamurella deserti]|uniref:rhomboid family intramembrane serine protease n=1 Tax=Nakamurella deserti TaxID=2164074 RepID=UPI000DBE0AB0|nr:rhomboid family intramembrane serine protease [Nakamurella deserti]
MTFPVTPSPNPRTTVVPKSRNTLVPARWQQAAIVPGVLVAVMVVVQIVNSVPALNVVQHTGIDPRRVDGLLGILTAPFVHGSWSHLLANAVPLMIFGFLLMVNGARQFIAVTVLVWLVSGIGVWLTAASGTTVVGASGIVFGWLAYLVVRGVFTRNLGQILVGLVLLALWGGIFWGVLPGANGISWQAHLFGALGGVLAAFLAAKADGPRRKTPALTA